MYNVLGAGSKGRSVVWRVLYFAGIIIGIDWLLFNLFGLVFFDLSLLDVAARALWDLAFIALGVFASEYILGFRNF